MPNRMIGYGYGWEDGKIVIIEREAVIVKRIFQEYIAGSQLQEIAERLTKEKIEYYLSNSRWDKNRIFRIIENKKYIGINEFPAIITEEEYVKANEEKTKRGKRKIALSGEIEYLKKIAVCAQCGSLFRRRTKWKTREKWFCSNGCENEVYVDDGLIFHEIMSVVEEIKNTPDLLKNEEDNVSYQPTAEIRRYTNEIGRMINQPNPSFSAGKKLILDCAALKFQACRNTESQMYSDSVIKKIESILENKVIDINFLSETVSEIKICKNGGLIVRFSNGAIVYGQKAKAMEAENNATKDSHKDRRKSFVDEDA